MQTPKGSGQAILVIDYSSEHNLIWTVIIDATGEIWSFQNPHVRGQKNVTMERMVTNSIPEIGSYAIPYKKEAVKHNT
jgi:hypothetical protein